MPQQIPEQILIQTTTPELPNANELYKTLSALVDLLQAQTHANGTSTYQVTFRHRKADRQGDDVVLARLSESEYSQLWLIGTDEGEIDSIPGHGLTLNDGHGIHAFVSNDGALLTTQSSVNTGKSFLRLGGLALSHQFHEAPLSSTFGIHSDDVPYAQNLDSAGSIITISKPGQGPIVACLSLDDLTKYPSTDTLKGILDFVSKSAEPAYA